MSEIYIGPDYWRETDEPAARHVARQAIAEHRERRIVKEAFAMEWWAGFWRGAGVASLALGALLALAVLAWRVM